jgi:hypothetical protein
MDRGGVGTHDTYSPILGQSENTTGALNGRYSQPTSQPTNPAALCDFRVFRQSPRCCKSLKNLIRAD